MSWLERFASYDGEDGEFVCPCCGQPPDAEYVCRRCGADVSGDGYRWDDHPGEKVALLISISGEVAQTWGK